MIITARKQGRTFKNDALRFERIPMKGEQVQCTGFRLLISKVSWTINGLASIDCHILPGDWNKELGALMAVDGFTEVK